MLAAAESGNAARQRAHSGLMQQYEAGRQQANTQFQQGMQAGESIQKQDQLEIQNRRQLESQQLAEAKAGFTREQALEQEMADGERLNRQMEKPFEADRGRLVQSEDAKALQDREMGLREMNARTQAQNAATARMNALVSSQKATAQLSAARGKDATAQAKEAYKQEVSKFGGMVESEANLYNRAHSGKMTPADVSNIRGMMQDNPSPEIQQELERLEAGIPITDLPGISRALQNRVSTTAMQMVMGTGTMPEGDLIDWSSPIMQQFQQNTGRAKQMLGFMDIGGMMSKMLGVDSLASRNRMVNQLAANMTMMAGATDQVMGAQQQDPQQGGGGAPLPSTSGGQPSDPGATNKSRRDAAAAATSAERQRGGSPSDALRAGQSVDPTAQRDRPWSPPIGGDPFISGGGR